MNSCVKYMRYLLLLFIMTSCLATLVVLGLDLDLLLNGPDYLTKIITNIVNRLHQEEIVDQEELREVLLDARQSLWVHIPMLTILVISVMMLFLNCVGCAGACLHSYSLLSGFTMIMIVNLVLYLCLSLWIFVNNMEDSVMDSYVSEKITQYHLGEGIFNLVIDTVQRDLQCCGFRKQSDWSGSFPASCCPDSCAGQGQGCLLVEENLCVADSAYNTSCLEKIRSSLLNPGSSMIGVIGVSFLVAVGVVAVTTALSLCLCIAARRSRGGMSTLKTRNCKEDEDSYLEMMRPRLIRK